MSDCKQVSMCLLTAFLAVSFTSADSAGLTSDLCIDRVMSATLTEYNYILEVVLGPVNQVLLLSLD